MKKQRKNHLLFLTHLRFKKNWKYELFTFLGCLISVIFVLIPSLINNLNQYQPNLSSEYLYQDAKRISFLSLKDIPDNKNFKISSGVSEKSNEYLFTIEDNGTQYKYQIDSSSLIDSKHIDGRLPNKSGEAIIGTSDTSNRFAAYHLDNLNNFLGLNTSLNIVGRIKTKFPTLFLYENDFSLTSKYKDFKNNISTSISLLSFKDKNLIFDTSIDPSQIVYNDDYEEITLTYLNSIKTLKVVNDKGINKSYIKLNPNIFSSPSDREYKTIVFDSFKDKKDFLKSHELMDIYDRFSPNGGDNMEKVDINPNIFIILPLIFIPLYITALIITTKHRKLDCALEEIKVDQKLKRLSDLFILMITSIMSLICLVITINIIPLFFNNSNTLGYIGIFPIILSLVSWLFLTMTSLLIRWRSYEI